MHFKSTNKKKHSRVKALSHPTIYQRILTTIVMLLYCCNPAFTYIEHLNIRLFQNK